MIRSSLQSGFDQSLGELAAAIAANEPERICPAYLAAKRLWTGTVGELLATIGHRCGGQSSDAIVAAFSHLRCYMCQDGASSCPSCEGAGGDCTTCDGTGMEACSFCGGTGWASEEMIPPEFRPAVKQQHVNKAIKQAQKLAELRDVWQFGVSARHLPREKQIEVGLWLLRLKCRFDTLAAQAIDRKQLQFQTLAKHAAKLLDAMAKARAAK
jgi:hypothetical protein